MWSFDSECLFVGGGGIYSKIKNFNSIRTAFSVSFESLRILRQETGWCPLGIFREVYAWGIHDLSLHDFFQSCVSKLDSALFIYLFI